MGCLCHYKTRTFQSKGALLILMWNFATYSILFYPNYPTFNNSLLGVPYVFALLCMPIIGHISDNLVCRHKVIHYCMLIMFATLILSNTVLLVQNYAWKSQALKILDYITGYIRLVGIIGFLINSMQFGIDQLASSPSFCISSFINWHIWTIYLAALLNNASQECVFGDNYRTISYTILPFLSAFMLVSDLKLNNWLNTEPVSKNTPLKLLYRVLKYAAKNKYPRLRSAFTYWEDKPYSRLDLGKSKYGGPFTVEQVEDVKTFFRLIAVIIIFMVLASNVYVLASLRDTNVRSEDFKSCYTHISRDLMVNGVIIVMVPVIEFLIYPLILKCTCYYKIKILHKVVLAAVLCVAVNVFYLSLHTATLLTTNSTSTYNVAEDRGIISGAYFENVEFFLQIMAEVIAYLIVTTSLEFICAQSPRSLLGLLIGIFYMLGSGLILLVTLFSTQIFYWFKVNQDKFSIIWFLTANTGLAILLAITSSVILNCYRYRKRDDVLGNNQIFAVDYFTKYLYQNNEE